MAKVLRVLTAISLLGACCSLPAIAAPETAAPKPPAASAAQPPPEAAAKPEPSRAERLDRLFGELKRQADPDAAGRIAGKIDAIWSESGSATVDLLMTWSEKAAREKHYATALDLLDQVIVLEPEYAAGWNERATVHFLMNHYSKSMADIDRTLALEPRHFGALSGMASIFKALGKDRLAMRTLEKVLAIYPADRQAQQRLGQLADQLAGQGI